LWKKAKEQNEVATDLGWAKQDNVCDYKCYRHCGCGGFMRWPWLQLRHKYVQAECLSS